MSASSIPRADCTCCRPPRSLVCAAVRALRLPYGHHDANRPSVAIWHVRHLVAAVLLAATLRADPDVGDRGIICIMRCELSGQLESYFVERQVHGATVSG